MKAEQIYDEEFADRTGSTWDQLVRIERKYRRDFLDQKNQLAEWFFKAMWATPLQSVPDEVWCPSQDIDWQYTYGICRQCGGHVDTNAETTEHLVQRHLTKPPSNT